MRQLLEQADKFKALKASIAEGMEDIQAGKVKEWNMQEFLTNARAAAKVKK